ncbi:MAG: hypothetical protein IT538_02340 [Variibacter sp.]|nr:hypothetical protein [Variibacter sp.]
MTDGVWRPIIARMVEDPADRCPELPEDTAELYLLGRLDARAARIFEDHCVTCPGCAEVVEQQDLVIRLLRCALRGKTAAAGS